ncbi:MAG: hypothetical protein ACI90V_007205 [Bacillariaceae sp.]
MIDSKRDENVQLFKLKVLYYCARDENNLLFNNNNNNNNKNSSLTTKPFPPLNCQDQSLIKINACIFVLKKEMRKYAGPRPVFSK